MPTPAPITKLNTTTGLSTATGLNSKFRLTQSAIDAGKKLFGQSAYLMGPQLATQLLIAAGVPVPKGVQVTADVAQMVMAGGATVTAVEQAATISSMVSPVAAGISAAIDLLELCGVMDASSPMAQVITLGVDTAMVIAGGGINVLADIKLALDLTADICSAQIGPKLKGEATNTLAAIIAQRQAPQIHAAALNFADYQSGKLSIFEFMGAVAEDAPELFLNYFPDLKQFIPTGTLTTCVTSSGSTLFGGAQSYNACYAAKVIRNDKWSVQSAILAKYVDPWVKPFMDLATQMNSPSLAISKLPNGMPYIDDAKVRSVNGLILDGSKFLAVDKMAVLSMLPPYFDLLPDEGFDVRPFLAANFLSPADFGDTFLYDELTSGQSKYFDAAGRTKKQAGVTFNGVDYFTTAQQALIDQQNAANTTTQSKLNLINSDNSGNIYQLLNDDNCAQAIYDWGNIPTLKGDTTKVTRSMRNYWSALSILQKVMTDPYMSSSSGMVTSLYFSFLAENAAPTIQYLSDLHKRLQFLSTARKMNVQAVNNVCTFMGVGPDQLVKLNPLEQGKPAVFGYK